MQLTNDVLSMFVDISRIMQTTAKANEMNDVTQMFC